MDNPREQPHERTRIADRPAPAPEPADVDELLRDIVGYLNFSSGAAQPAFQRNLNELYRLLDASGEPAPTWQRVHLALQRAMATGSLLAASDRKQAACSDAAAGGGDAGRASWGSLEQAEAVVRLVFDRVLPAYRVHHRDLLCHLSDAELFQPFFVARVFEAVLGHGPPWQEEQRIIASTLETLNDFIGHRPVAVLQTRQKIEPYPHERVRPIPLYLRGAGVAHGKYHDLVAKALEIVRETDAALLDEACFDPALLDELALDPRAYDFHHPAHRRPNYQFGEWDPHHIDNQGRYRRFVVRQVTLDALLDFVAGAGATPDPARSAASLRRRASERLYEAGAVLAGTILMAAGTSGRGPDTYDSSTTLATLVPRIAAYRDAFYAQLLARVSGEHGAQLRQEAAALKQPFAAARQHLNRYLGRQRALQTESAYLSRLFAEMGEVEASRRRTARIPTASARMVAEIAARMVQADRLLAHSVNARGETESEPQDGDRAKDLLQAAELLAEIEDWLQRAIGCGALVDPWNILGFQGQFSIFPALEDSVADPRVPELTGLVERLFRLYARALSAAAAFDGRGLGSRLSAAMERLAGWWDQFASVEVSGVGGFSGHEAWESAVRTAEALAEWRCAGEEAGDIAFWRRQVGKFNSPRAYALVVEALLEKRDLVASQALLMAWLSQAEQVPLDDPSHSFYALARRWMGQATVEAQGERRETGDAGRGATAAAAREAAPSSWTLIRKFFDFLEANAEDYWNVPTWEPAGNGSGRGAAQEGAPGAEPAGAEDAEDEDESPFRAAYESVVYEDSAADGTDADVLEGAGARAPDDDALELEASRLGKRLRFLAALAQLWRTAALALPPADAGAAEWLRRAQANRGALETLLDAVHRHRIAPPSEAHASLLEYDRRRQTKAALLDQILATHVLGAGAERALAAALPAATGYAMGVHGARWEEHAVALARAVARGDGDEVRERTASFLAAARQAPMLYVPHQRGGDPRDEARARSLLDFLGELLERLPALGLLRETYHVLKAVRAMERPLPQGDSSAETTTPSPSAPAASEFARLFEVAFTGVVEALVVSAAAWDNEKVGPARQAQGERRRPAPGGSPAPGPQAGPRESADAELLTFLAPMTESFLRLWLDYTQSVRLSVFDTLTDDAAWRRVVEFIRTYGGDLFTQKFLTLGSLRAILDSGAAAYLRALEEHAEGAPAWSAYSASEALPGGRLLEDLGRRIAREEAARLLQLVVEAVAERYTEYLDYNSSTTQSDRGDCLYMLLDFLRLKAGYERVAWSLRPLFLTHALLARHGREAAAAQWTRVLTERTAAMADWHQRRYEQLEKVYGLRLASVSELISQRFVRPLELAAIHAMMARVAGGDGARVSASLESPGDDANFRRLEEAIDDYARAAGTAGPDVPAWLVSLTAALRSAHQPEAPLMRPGSAARRTVVAAPGGDLADLAEEPHRQRAMLSRDELRRQWDAWEQPL